MRPLEAKHLRGGFRRSPWPLDGDKDRTCDCRKLDEADLGRLERRVKPFSAPAAVCQPALANYTSHRKHTQPEGRSSPAASPLEGGNTEETGLLPILPIQIPQLNGRYRCPGKCVSPCLFVQTFSPPPTLWQPAVAHQALTDAILSVDPTARATSAAHPALRPPPNTQAQNTRLSFHFHTSYSFPVCSPSVYFFDFYGISDGQLWEQSETASTSRFDVWFHCSLKCECVSCTVSVFAPLSACTAPTLTSCIRENSRCTCKHGDHVVEAGASMLSAAR